jgi:hypothetical protein
MPLLNLDLQMLDKEVSLDKEIMGWIWDTTRNNSSGFWNRFPVQFITASLTAHTFLTFTKRVFARAKTLQTFPETSDTRKNSIKL